MSEINMFTSDGFHWAGNETVSETTVIAAKGGHTEQNFDYMFLSTADTL